jgi:Dienelactone hydrolase family
VMPDSPRCSIRPTRTHAQEPRLGTLSAAARTRAAHAPEPMTAHRGVVLQSLCRFSVALWGRHRHRRRGLPASPDRSGSKVRCISALPKLDEHVPANVIPTLKSALDKAGTRYGLDVFPNSRHGFQFPERDVYEAHAAEESWSKIVAMWDRNLKIGSTPSSPR